MRPLVSKLTAAFLSVGAALSAQESPAPPSPPLEAGVQVGYLPLYGGDATVGGVHTWLTSARLGWRLPLGQRRAVIEVAYGYVRQDQDPYNRAPAFRFVGVFVRRAPNLEVGSGVRAFPSVGIGKLWVDAEEIACTPPSCFNEGGPNFKDGAFTTAVGGLGFLVRLTQWGALRSDVRLYAPFGSTSDRGDSDNARFELAGGLTVRF